MRQAPKCDYCRRDAELVAGAVMYPARPDLARLFFWRCEPCGAHVGCHQAGKGYGDGTVPLGRLANAELRAAKSAAHAAFDPLWRSGNRTRHQAYAWLAEELGIKTHNCHIGMFDVDLCRATVRACAVQGFDDITKVEP